MAIMLFRRKDNKAIEKKFTTFSEQLAQVFGQIKNDIDSINTRLDSNKSEMERLGQWIGYLNRNTQRISENHSKILQKQEKITENHHKLHTSHEELRQSHTRTADMAENLEKSHQKLSGAISEHSETLKSEILGHIQQHKELSNDEIQRLKAWIDYFSTHLDRQKGKEDALRQDISRIEQSWQESYSALRGLVNGIRSENNELKGSVSSIGADLEQARNELKNTILELESTKNELSSAKETIQNTATELESTKNLAESLQKIPKSESLPEEVPSQVPLQHQQQVIQPVVQPVYPQVIPTASSFQRHIMSRVLPNRKGYVLKFILDLIKENQHSTKEIEEIVVNEKQLCGRTSFYAYLKELKLKGRISYAEIDERQILVCTDAQTSLMDRLDKLQ